MTTDTQTPTLLDRLYARVNKASWGAGLALGLLLWAFFWIFTVSIGAYDRPFATNFPVERRLFGLDPFGWTSLIFSLFGGYLLVMWVRLRRLERYGAGVMARIFNLDRNWVAPRWQAHFDACRACALKPRLIGFFVGFVSSLFGPPGFSDLLGIPGIYPADLQLPFSAAIIGAWYLFMVPIMAAYVGDAMHKTFYASRFFTQLIQTKLQVDLFQPGQMDPIMRIVQSVALAWGLAGAILAMAILDTDVNRTVTLPMVAIPSIFAVILLLRPMLALKKRTHAKKAAELQKLNSLLAKEWADTNPDTADPEAIGRLGGLLAMEARIKNVRDWPLDISGLGRLAFYIIIPLLSWSGAAVVERAIDSLF